MQLLFRQSHPATIDWGHQMQQAGFITIATLVITTGLWIAERMPPWLEVDLRNTEKWLVLIQVVRGRFLDYKYGDGLEQAAPQLAAPKAEN